MTCDYCNNVYTLAEFVECNGCLLCEQCALNDGYEECSICGAWDELDGAMCYECSSD